MLLTLTKFFVIIVLRSFDRFLEFIMKVDLSPAEVRVVINALAQAEASHLRAARNCKLSEVAACHSKQIVIIKALAVKIEQLPLPGVV